MSQIDKETVYELIKVDLGKLNPDKNTEEYIRHLQEAAVELIGREGAALNAPYSVEDAQLIVMYTAYLYRKRATQEPMPRMLRWALNNRILSERRNNDS